MALGAGSQAALSYWIGLLGMIIATGYVLYKAIGDTDHLKYHLVLSEITGLKIISYALIMAGVGVFEVNGATQVVTRYVDWLLTTPFMLAAVAMLSKPGNKTVGKLLALDVLMILVPLTGPFISGALYWASFAFGCICYIGMAYILAYPTSKGPGLENEEVRIVFTKLRNLILAIWPLYPLVVIFGPQALGFLTFKGQAIAISYLDLVSKGVFVYIGAKAATRIPEISATFTPKKK